MDRGEQCGRGHQLHEVLGVFNDHLEVGKFYLFACPWDWTFVGRYVRRVDLDTIEVEDSIYFTRTGATFDRLCKTGLIQGESGSKTHGGPRFIPAAGPKWEWTAATPWAKGGGRGT